jgi:glycerophosphoryl diester phosphodiesterase
MPNHPQVERIGHRGAPRDRMENTLPSFRRAVELGATAVELDVHVTADGVPVVHHDPELNSRVTPARLARASLAELGSRDIQTVRLSSGDQIPTLLEVLEALTPATKVYVEIKGGAPAIIAAVVTRFKESIAVHSFDHESIVEMARIAPAIRRGILVEKSTDDLAGLMRHTQASDVWPAHKLVDAAFMDQARDCGARVIPWTVNSARELGRLVGHGVAGICTNDLTLFASN